MNIEIDLSKFKFCFALPAYDGKLCMETCQSMLESTNKMTQMGIPWSMVSLKSCALVDSARNQLMHKFLHETNADILIFIDTDISWKWESMERLLAWSTMYDCVSGIYCSRKDPANFVIHVDKYELNEYGLLPISGAGLGFTAISRLALEQLDVPEYHTQEYTLPLKQFTAVGVVDGVYIGEDIHFFKVLKEHGIQSYADPGIILKHHGTKTYEYQFQDILSKLLGENNGF